MIVPVFEIPYDAEGIFKRRNNRFLGTVDLVGARNVKGVKVHVRDPGRLKEILFPGNNVLLKRVEKASRKTKWDLVAGSVNDRWVLVNSGYHRRIAEWLLNHRELCPFGKVDEIVPEVRLGRSRLDFLLKKDGRNIWTEIKGCTLAKDGAALFPDAPTSRGRRHVEELIEAMENGERAALIILIFRREAECFSPNQETDPDFSEVFRRGRGKGLEIHPLKFFYAGETLFYEGPVSLCNE